MNRKSFIKYLALLPITGAAMKLKDLNKITEPFNSTEKMPALFLGHGSPMNAIEDWWVSDLHSFLSGLPATYNIDALQGSEVFLLKNLYR